jgi:AhpD family alkylhydroperoxidase
MNYAEISRDIISNLYKSYENLKHSPLNQELRLLVELRVSQMNGCTYCCSLHTEEAIKLEIDAKKIGDIKNWKASPYFSRTEKLALEWAEVITTLEPDQHSIKQELFTHFSEREIVDLTACIALMNALNRIAISLK